MYLYVSIMCVCSECGRYFRENVIIKVKHMQVHKGTSEA